MNTLPAPGTMMPDDTVYVGFVPSTGQFLYAQTADADLPLSFNSAAAYAQRLGHDWRVPTPEEAELLNAHRNDGALKGTFNALGAYWTSETTAGFDDYGTMQRFDVGYQAAMLKDTPISLRCVRALPRKA